MAWRRLILAALAAASAGACPAAARVTDFQNDEFNFHVVFPAGSRVCPALNAGHTYGFYAWYGPSATCDAAQPETKADTATGTMGVYATYNTTYQRSAYMLLPKACRPQAANKPAPAIAPAANPVPVPAAAPSPVATPPVSAAVDAKTLAALAFRRYKSLQCATQEPDGSIDIDVVTQAGKWVDGNEPSFQTPLINYRATLHTAPERLDKDLAMFRQFLSKVDIKF